MRPAQPPMNDPTPWGITATIKAPTPEILAWAAYHIDLGAAHIRVYLDDGNPTAFQALSDHPKVTPILCDETHWQDLNGKRPGKHQIRQTLNATQAYRQMTEVDWLAHIDVDEFLIPNKDLAVVLGSTPPDVITARVRPMEQLSGGDGTAFKDFMPPRHRDRLSAEIYPTYGEYLKGGFLSHVAGKIFVRMGQKNVKLRIHNAFRGPDQIEETIELDDVRLAHCHAPSWEAWYAHFRYRHKKGSYRADLGPTRRAQQGGITMHQLFTMIEAEGGTPALRAFFDEVCADTPALRAALARHGLLREAMLPLDDALAKHFPDASIV